MVAALEEWSFFDHLRFLARAWYWVLGAGLIAGGLAGYSAHGRVVSSAEVLLQMGHNPISGWLEPPNELLARLQTANFLDGESAGRPEGAVPTLSAKQIPNSGYLRLRASCGDPAMAQWSVDAAVSKIVREHGARAEMAKRALARRIGQLDKDIARLRVALDLPINDSPEMVTERLRLVQRIGMIERERDDLQPDVKVASPAVSRPVHPVVVSTSRAGNKQAIYGGFAGLLLALTLLYLREGLRAPSHGAQASADSID